MGDICQSLFNEVYGIIGKLLVLLLIEHKAILVRMAEKVIHLVALNQDVENLTIGQHWLLRPEIRSH